MKQEEIKGAVSAAMQAMNKAYSPSGEKKVFDEVLLIHVQGTKIRLNWYESARSPETITASFQKDFAAIRGEVKEGGYSPGDFHFDSNADGSVFDAFIYLGDEQYLVFNNIALSMSGVRENGDWIKAQLPFVDFAQRFESH